MKWEFIKSIEKTHGISLVGGHNWKIPTYYLPTKYYDLFTLLFRLENSLRIFVFFVLKNALKNDWRNAQIGEASEDTLGKLFKKRKSEHDKYGYLSFGSNNPLLYLTLDELFSVITSRSLRKFFGRYISGSLEVWSHKFGEVKAIRNNLSHFRKITDKDIERVITTIEDLDKSLLFVFRELFDEENLRAYNFSNAEGLLSAWDYLLDQVSNSVLDLETSRNDPIVRLTIRTRTKVFSIDQYSELELYIKYCSVRLMRLSNFLADILPYLIYFTCDDEIVPCLTSDRKFSGEMTSSKICLYFDRVEFQEQYRAFFSTIKDLLTEMESDCRKIDENSPERLKIYQAFCCNLLCDLSFTTEPKLTVKERHIEDWTGFSFIGTSFIDFVKFPWIGESSRCSPSR